MTTHIVHTVRIMQEILLTYTAVGIFEHWETSMALFNARVKSPVAHWDAQIARNPGLHNEEREKLLQWAAVSPEVHSILSADLLLYRLGFEVFKQQTRDSLGTEWR